MLNVMRNRNVPSLLPICLLPADPDTPVSARLHLAFQRAAVAISQYRQEDSQSQLSQSRQFRQSSSSSSSVSRASLWELLPKLTFTGFLLLIVHLGVLQCSSGINY
jgi:hypothetical protein